jgi:hypothetical protein
MKAGGFGGFEIQPVYPMELDEPGARRQERALPVARIPRRGELRQPTARANGLRVDMTLASGWPYGGPHIGVTQSAASRLRVATVEVPAGAAASHAGVMNGESWSPPSSARHGQTIRSLKLVKPAAFPWPGDRVARATAAWW